MSPVHEAAEHTYAIVLAAGEGTRMRSQRPKPLHRICGRPMVLHVIHALHDVAPTSTVVVVGHGADLVTAKVSVEAPGFTDIQFALQEVQHGTGHAVNIGLDTLADRVGSADIDDPSTVLVLPGDTPLLERATIERLVREHRDSGHGATVLVSRMADPTGYGRVIRAKDGRVVRIVEQRDGTPEELAVDEINTSIYAFRRDLLGPALRQVTPDNAQREYYLTDVISVLAGMGHRIGAVEAPAAETQGVNDRWQLAMAERELRARTNRHWLLSGVTMLDPRQTFIDVDVRIGRDVTLYPGTMLQGATVIGDSCEIGPDTRLVDSTVGNGCVIENSVGREASVGEGARVGPFAFLGPGSRVADGRDTGAFYDSTRGGPSGD